MFTHHNIFIKMNKILTFIGTFFIVLNLNAQKTKTLQSRGELGVSAFRLLEQKYDLHEAAFDLRLERDSRFIEGSVTYSFLAKADIDTFAIELHPNFTVDSVLIDPISSPKIKLTTFLRKGNELYIVLNDKLKSSVVYKSIKIAYRGSSPGSINDWGEGVVQKTDPTYGKSVHYSLTCPYFGHHWYPCKQVLTDLIDATSFNITTSAANKAVSNGILTKVDTLANNKLRFNWHSDYPINYYLVSFVVSDYVTYNMTATLPDSTLVPIEHYLFTSQGIAQKKTILDYTDDYLVNYSKYYGSYPFRKEKFGSVQVPLSGGMEHQTCVNLSTGYDKYLLAHEMSHQWWGDNVSIASLHDVWLNEGFATFSEYLTAEKLHPTEAVATLNTLHNQAFSASGSTYAEDTTSFEKIYDYNKVYAKGAVLVQMLRFEVANDKLFFDALAKYQNTYKGKNVTAKIFQTFIEKECKVDLTNFFSQWYYGFGYPKFSLKWNNNNAKQLIVKSLETTTNTKTPLFKTPLELRIVRAVGGDTLVKVFQKSNDDLFLIPNLTNVTNIIIDPNNWILNKVGTIVKDTTLKITATNEVFDGQLFIIPNPTKGIFQLKNTAWRNYKVEIMDMNGRMIRSVARAQDDDQFDISAFPNAVYIVRISKGNVSHSQQIVLQKE